MNQLKHYLKRLRNMNFKRMFDVADKVKKITGKPKIWIVTDMVISSILYSAGYLEYFEYEFFLLSHKQRKTFMTAADSNKIIVRYNQKDYRHFFSDKSLFNQTFHDLVGRDWVDIRHASKDERDDFLKRHDVIMIKETQNLMGTGIERVVLAEVDPEDLYHQCMQSGQYLWEEFFIQHPKMNELYDKSVNTLRIITFFDGSKTHVLESVIKMGNGGHLDNFGAGGMYSILDDRGEVLYPAFDGEGDAYPVHPASETPIVGFQVPLFDDVIRLVTKASQRIPQVPYVGWDVAIGPNGPVLIEGNYNTGVFQMKPSLSGQKTGLKPKFKETIEF